jgi:hypothetical protein
MLAAKKLAADLADKDLAIEKLTADLADKDLAIEKLTVAIELATKQAEAGKTFKRS